MIMIVGFNSGGTMYQLAREEIYGGDKFSGELQNQTFKINPFKKKILD